MCDQDTIDDNYELARRSGDVSRRQFGALALGTGLLMSLPRLADAADTQESEVEIKTPDGTCDAYFAHPASGSHPAVLIWPDIFGLRPAFRQMGRRLSESGYSVLVVNPFYRQKKAPVVPPGTTFQDQNARQTLFALAGALTVETAQTDAKAFISWLDSQKAVDKKKKMGTTGYCMGGPLTFRTAALFPDRIGGAGSFHGGGLVTDKPDSPHLLIPKIKAHYLVAIAANDDERQPEAKTVLRDAFGKTKVPAEVEVYAGAMHGWCPPDSEVYNHDSAEEAWGRLLATFKAGLV